MQYISFYFLLAGLFAIMPVYSQPVSSLSHSPKFSAPLEIPLLLSSSYGEYRSGHFHAGIDFKTQQTEGKRVLAVDSGYIYRIVVLAGSYGNALYLKHPSGHITLYGHLSKFTPTVASYIKDQQYRKKSFSVDLYPEAGRFVFRKGELIGLSGNSGTSFGAHLHFEIRDKTGSIPLNPLNYGFNIKDRTPPGINWLKIYDMEGYGNNQMLKVKKGDAQYYVDHDTIQISGSIGIGIETYDFLDNSLNECGPFTIEMTSDNTRIFFCKLDSIPFSDGGYINSYFDYEERLRSGIKVQKLFIAPNNKLNIYKVALNRGVLKFQDTIPHKIDIIVTDTYGNQSYLKFYVQFVNRSAQNTIADKKDSIDRFYYDSLNVYENEDIRISVPSGALFENIDFQYEKTENDSSVYSSVHKVHNRYTPLYQSYILSIRPKNIPASLHSKALIASRGPKGMWFSEGGEFKNHFVTTRVKTFGEFIVILDTIPPRISPVNFVSEASYNANQMVSFTIVDSISGIHRYTGTIDKKWALFEYDAKNDLIYYIIDSGKLIKGIMHEVEIIVVDNKNNISRFADKFFY